MLAVMSDASGFASGGVSNVITVGPSSGTSQCDTTTPGAGFTFNTDSALAQCRTYTFSDYTTAIQPVTIFAMIPGGDSFILQPPNGPTSFDWVTNVASSTELVFFMMDSQGHSGGSSQVNIVGLSDDATCLTGNIPASVANRPRPRPL
ncbi:hypothetical protein B0H21DRAFT_534238 [Amylocystis lapponica]|nr:hypothetical protein B0H21DRAFT_534238 [Amylocystis lapponica]